MNFATPINRIYLVVCSSNTVIAFVFLSLAVIYRRRPFNISTFLACNTVFAILLFSIINLTVAIYMLIWDQQESPIVDSFCSLRAYIYHSTIAAVHHSFILQALGRYAKVRQVKLLKNTNCQLGLVVTQWICDFLFDLPVFLTGNMPKMPIDNLCFVSLKRLDLIFYMAGYSFFCSDLALFLIHRSLVRYVRCISSRFNSRQQMRIRRDMTVVQRIVLLNGQLGLVGLPALVFIIINAVRADLLPHQSMRIVLLLMNSALLPALIILFWFTPDLRRSVKSYFQRILDWSSARVNPRVEGQS